MHHRTPSSGFVSDLGEQLTLVPRLPPRAVTALGPGHRTPTTCPASPLIGCGTDNSLTLSSRSAGSTPARAPPRSVSCACLPADLSQSHVLPNIVTSVYESNITAVQCYAAYGRTAPGTHVHMHAAPPLSGGRNSLRAGLATGDPDGHLRPHPHVTGAAAAPAGLLVHIGPNAASTLANDITDVDFGLAACLATPMDPGSGLERRLLQLPATTTAARSAASKLAASNDILQDASSAGEWARRLRRRRRREAAQGEGELQPDDTLRPHEAGTTGPHPHPGARPAAGAAGKGGGAGRLRGADLEDVTAGPAAAAAACTLLETGQQGEELLAGELSDLSYDEYGLTYDTLDEDGLLMEPDFLGLSDGVIPSG